MLKSKRNTYIGKLNKEGYDIITVATVTGGKPQAHSIMVGLEPISTGGSLVNIFTTKETKALFENSQLKSLMFDTMNEVRGIDYRSHNFVVNVDFSVFTADDTKIVAGYEAEYKKAGIKSLAFDYLKDNICEPFVFDYIQTLDIVDNTMSRAIFTPIDPTIYISSDDINNIKLNKQAVEGTKLPKCAKSTLESFKSGTHNCALFYGEASTGKSFATRIMAAELGIPVYSYNFAAGSDETFVQGKYAPKEDEAGFQFLKNSFIKAYSEGGMFIAEELNYAYANVTGPLNSALDFLKKITLANEKEVAMHPNFRMVTCINPGYEGTQPLNRALLSRQEIVVRFRDLSPKEFSERLEARYGYKNQDFSRRFAEFINNLNKALLTQSIDGYASLREVESCLKLLLNQSKVNKLNIDQAIEESILNKVMLNETESTFASIKQALAEDIKELSEYYDASVSTDADLEELVVATLDDDQINSIFGALDDSEEVTA